MKRFNDFERIIGKKYKETMKVWPNKQVGGYGDYIHVLREPKR